LSPAALDVIVHVAVVLEQPVHANDVGLPLQEAVSVTLVLMAGDALLAASVQDGRAVVAAVCQLTATEAAGLLALALFATTE
jgi:hypothetical protein